MTTRSDRASFLAEWAAYEKANKRAAREYALSPIVDECALIDAAIDQCARATGSFSSREVSARTPRHLVAPMDVNRRIRSLIQRKQVSRIPDTSPRRYEFAGVATPH